MSFRIAREYARLWIQASGRDGSEMMLTREVIEIVSICTVPLAIAGVVLQSIVSKVVLGVRALQLLALVILGAAILVLTLENILEKSAAGAILGTLAGYFFSQINEFDKRGTQTALPKQE